MSSLLLSCISWSILCIVLQFLILSLCTYDCLIEGTLGKSGEALTKMWAQFTSGRGNNANSGAKREVEMSKVGLMKPIDEDLED